MAEYRGGGLSREIRCNHGLYNVLGETSYVEVLIAAGEQ
jgi:hypothetical protein